MPETVCLWLLSIKETDKGNGSNPVSLYKYITKIIKKISNSKSFCNYFSYNANNSLTGTEIIVGYSIVIPGSNTALPVVSI